MKWRRKVEGRNWILNTPSRWLECSRSVCWMLNVITRKLLPNHKLPNTNCWSLDDLDSVGDELNTQLDPSNGLGEGNQVVNRSPSEVLVDPDLVGISLGLKLWSQLTTQNSLHQPRVGWWVPLRGRTPLSQQHTDLCFDYCCSVSSHKHNFWMMSARDLAIQIISQILNSQFWQIFTYPREEGIFSLTMVKSSSR